MVLSTETMRSMLMMLMMVVVEEILEVRNMTVMSKILIVHLHNQSCCWDSSCFSSPWFL